MRLPSVITVGHVHTLTSPDLSSVLITRYLERSMPYRTLFMQQSLERYRQHLMDAIAGLLVQLHLAGIFWGIALYRTRYSGVMQGLCEHTWWMPRQLRYIRVTAHRDCAFMIYKSWKRI